MSTIHSRADQAPPPELIADPSPYKDDVVEWSAEQAELLRRAAAGEGEGVRDLIDWENIIEEIEAVGSEQVHAVESLLVQVMRHRLKAAAWPASRDVPHWQAEARVFLADAQRRYTRSMRQRIDLALLYRTAVRGLPETLDGLAPTPDAVPAQCPWTLDALLDHEALP